MCAVNKGSEVSSDMLMQCTEALYKRRFSWVTAATTEQAPSLGDLCFLVAHGELGLQRLEGSVVL